MQTPNAYSFFVIVLVVILLNVNLNMFKKHDVFKLTLRQRRLKLTSETLTENLNMFK